MLNLAGVAVSCTLCFAVYRMGRLTKGPLASVDDHDSILRNERKRRHRNIRNDVPEAFDTIMDSRADTGPTDTVADRVIMKTPVSTARSSSMSRSSVPAKSSYLWRISWHKFRRSGQKLTLYRTMCTPLVKNVLTVNNGNGNAVYTHLQFVVPFCLAPRYGEVSFKRHDWAAEKCLNSDKLSRCNSSPVQR